MNSVVYNFSYGKFPCKYKTVFYFGFHLSEKEDLHILIHCQYISISNMSGNRLDIFLYIDSFNIHYYKLKFNSIFQQWKFKLRKIF